MLLANMKMRIKRKCSVRGSKPTVLKLSRPCTKTIMIETCEDKVIWCYLVADGARLYHTRQNVRSKYKYMNDLRLCSAGVYAF
jgi:hypothetical protein